jgi:hypothetical protein
MQTSRLGVEKTDVVSHTRLVREARCTNSMLVNTKSRLFEARYSHRHRSLSGACWLVTLAPREPPCGSPMRGSATRCNFNAVRPMDSVAQNNPTAWEGKGTDDSGVGYR